jgi:hypothetical protein
MNERRVKRSTSRSEALQYLVEAVADRSGVGSLVLVDDAGQIVAGMGMPHEVGPLAGVARDVARRGAPAALVDAVVARGADVTARSVTTAAGRMHLAAAGDRMTKVGDAVRAVQRIVVSTATS